jgi:tRNA (guanine37-N1)-methyltransferase
MLIKPDVIEKCISDIQFNGKKIFLSPRGICLNQEYVESIARSNEDVLLLCGRYEGVDQRAIDHFEFEEISVGNYVLAGRVAALALMEAV